MSIVDKSYIGKGRVFASLRAGGRQFEIGNCSAAKLAASLEEKELKNFQTAGGGLRNSLDRVDSVSFSLDMYDLNQENLAMLTLGDKASITSGTGVSENATAYQGALIRTANIKPSNVVFTTPPGAVEGVDFEVIEAGIVPIVGSTVITEALAVTYTYDHPAANVVEALTKTSEEWTITFSGLNEAQGGSARVVDMWRVKIAPFNELDLISDDFAPVTLTGKLLEDPSITGAGLSKYFKDTALV